MKTYEQTHEGQLERTNDMYARQDRETERARFASPAEGDYRERKGRQESAAVFLAQSAEVEISHFPSPSGWGVVIGQSNASAEIHHHDSGLSLRARGTTCVYVTPDQLREIHRRAGEILAEIDGEG